MKLYRKKPVVIEAVQYNGANGIEIEKWSDHKAYEDINDERICIETLEGIMTGSVGDWIIHGVSGEFYPCKPDIFEKTYEAVA